MWKNPHFSLFLFMNCFCRIFFIKLDYFHFFCSYFSEFFSQRFSFRPFLHVCLERLNFRSCNFWNNKMYFWSKTKLALCESWTLYLSLIHLFVHAKSWKIASKECNKWKNGKILVICFLLIGFVLSLKDGILNYKLHGIIIHHI